MPRKCLSIICMIALVAATSAPSLAAGPDPYLGSPHYGLDSYRRAGELTSGVYLRIPFSATPRRSLSETRFGLTLGARMPARERYDRRRMLLDRPKLIDLSIGLRGRESLRLNGLSTADMTALYADEDGEPKKDRVVWPWWVLGGTGAVLLWIAVVKSGVKDATKNLFQDPKN